MQRRTDFAAGSEQESERQGASRKNNLAETNAQTPVLGGWLQVDKRGPEKWNISNFNKMFYRVFESFEDNAAEE